MGVRVRERAAETSARLETVDHPAQLVLHQSHNVVEELDQPGHPPRLVYQEEEAVEEGRVRREHVRRPEPRAVYPPVVAHLQHQPFPEDPVVLERRTGDDMRVVLERQRRVGPK